MHWSIVWIGYLLSWGLIPFILVRNKPPVSTLAWVWSVILFPYVGPVAFLVFGTDRLVRKRLRAGREMSAATARGEKQITPKTRALMDDLAPAERDTVELLSRLNDVSVTSAEDVRLLFGGADFYAELIRQVEEAKDHVHIEFFIYRKDERGQQMLDALVAAAKRGVEVRLLVDPMGSLGTPARYFRPLVAAGGKFAWFRTSQFFKLRWYINLRNHRKLQIIDARVAFVGGMNLGREYAGEDPSVGPWHDISTVIEGAAASKLQAVFADDWYFATGEKLLASKYYLHHSIGARFLVQPMPDGPDAADDPIQMSIVAMLGAVRDRAWLTAGYFVPQEPLLTALSVAAERGVDVRLLISEKTDHPYLVQIGRSYYEELLRHGVKIYEFDAAVNHSKCALFDDDWLMVGSANFDIRSMRLNFELNVLVRDRECASRLERALHGDFTAGSKQIVLEEFARRPFRQRLIESTLRPLAPLL
jgi:cardiolipin synthase A/B